MTIPYIIGRFSTGDAAETIVNAELIRPEPPSPATARPMMSIVED
jgi:hypothetical protein